MSPQLLCCKRLRADGIVDTPKACGDPSCNPKGEGEVSCGAKGEGVVGRAGACRGRIAANGGVESLSAVGVATTAHILLEVQHPDALPPVERAQTARKVSATRGGLGPPRGGIAARARERGACRGAALTLQERAETLSVIAPHSAAPHGATTCTASTDGVKG